MERQKKNRKIVLWTVVAIVVIVVFTVASNWESFSEGFNAGSRLAE